MDFRFLKQALLGWAFAMIASTSAFAQLDLGEWLNPGPLASPHAALEGGKNCVNCHATAQGVPDRKCLTCHTEIAEKLEKKRGFHGRQTIECVKCHSDHKGRAFDLSGLTRTKFDHAETGWPLEGSHRPLKCESCHKTFRVDVGTKKQTTRRTYLENKRDCVTCHNDVHNTKEPEFKECQRCHNVEKFRPAKQRLSFNHNRETKYPLTGAHARVNCYSCHKQKVWAPLAFDKCTNCHVDPHKGSLGPTCTKCHSTAGWRGAATPSTMTGGGGGKSAKAFDHEKTAFPLKGEHRGVTCVRCHGDVLGKMSGVKFAQCNGCHNNPHGNQFEVIWNKVKVCTDCHLEDGWPMLSFQHNRDSRYKLEEKHTLVPCQQCHVDDKYRWMTKAPECGTCHNDVHRGQFKSDCFSCHTQKGFDQVIFDHNKQSRFPLVGKHAYVNCANCHVEGRFKPLETNCNGCHNDFHKGTLGNECRRCHAPIAFNDIAFDHNRESKFKIDGQHAKVACNQCHTDYQYKIGRGDCVSCHLDVHKGTFGQACERCHSTQGFTMKSGFHDFGEFSLGGRHDRLDCISCHNDKAPVRQSPVICNSCHKDPHMNSMGQNCWNCHNQTAFLPATFRHNQTGFELSGAHRFLSCDRCHFNRVFGGLPQECSFCHLKDFNPALPQHTGQQPVCDQCHFTFGWRPAPRP
jgi:hypothetical protein